MVKKSLIYHDLSPGEKTKIRNCSKWNFYSLKCKTCQYELICADQWKVREWLEKPKIAPDSEDLQMNQ